MPPQSTSSPSRALLQALRPVRRRASCQCLHSPRPKCSPPGRSSQSTSSHRFLSTVSASHSEMEVSPTADSSPRPRWSQTPPAMRAPVRSRPRKDVEPLRINSDPRALDEMYTRFLGPGGDKMLSEESKWLAVTHKSFDHGRRGFNDRLSFLGQRILELQASLNLLTMADSSKELREKADSHGREPFDHPATRAIEILSGGSRAWLTHYKQLANLARQYGLPDVVRWVPKNPEHLRASGAEMVYAQAITAIIGAIALENGGATANKITKERILIPLGMRDRPEH